MEQENGPSAQVVNISQDPMEDNKTLKDAYSTTAATIFGIFQTIIGVVFFFGEIDIIQSDGPYNTLFQLCAGSSAVSTFSALCSLLLLCPLCSSVSQEELPSEELKVATSASWWPP